MLAPKAVSIFLRVCAIVARVVLTIVGAPLLGIVDILTILNTEILRPLHGQLNTLKAQLEAAESQPVNPLPKAVVDGHLGATEGI